MTAAATAVLVALAASGCGGGDGDGPNAAVSVEPMCERPDPSVVEAIETGLTVSGGGSLGAAYAVRSEDFKRIWMVAAEIEGEGLDGVVGVWATNEIDETASFFAADAIAREFSDWGSGQFELTDDGIREAEECLDEAP